MHVQLVQEKACDQCELFAVLRRDSSRGILRQDVMEQDINTIHRWDRTLSWCSGEIKSFKSRDMTWPFACHISPS